MTDFTHIPAAISPLVMTPLQAFCEKIMTSREPNQVIQRGERPYIERWELARKSVVPVHDNPDEVLGYMGWMPSELENLYLHAYKQSLEENPHCHPWGNATLVVRGWYKENVYKLVDGKHEFVGAFIRNQGDVVFRNAESPHAIVATSPDCVSLFATARKERDWGFHTDEGFVHSERYHFNSVGKPRS